MFDRQGMEALAGKINTRFMELRCRSRGTKARLPHVFTHHPRRLGSCYRRPLTLKLIEALCSMISSYDRCGIPRAALFPSPNGI